MLDATAVKGHYMHQREPTCTKAGLLKATRGCCFLALICEPQAH